MALQDVYNLSADAAFGQRCQAAIFNYCLNTVNAEVTNDVQTITVTGTPTGGSFTLGGAAGALTAAVAPGFNWTAQQLQAGINAAVAAGNSCICLGGPFPGTAISVTWLGGLANAPQNVMTITANNLTGGSSPNASVAHTTVGVSAINHAARAAKSTNILAGASLAQMFFALANDSTVQSDYTGGGKVQTAVTDAHISAAVASAFNAFI